MRVSTLFDSRVLNFSDLSQILDTLEIDQCFETALQPQDMGASIVADVVNNTSDSIGGLRSSFNVVHRVSNHEAYQSSKISNSGYSFFAHSLQMLWLNSASECFWI